MWICLFSLQEAEQFHDLAESSACRNEKAWDVGETPVVEVTPAQQMERLGKTVQIIFTTVKRP